MRHMHHRGWASFELNLDGLPADETQFADYLATLDLPRLEQLAAALRHEFDRVYVDDDHAASLDQATTAKLARYAWQVKAVKAALDEHERTSAAAEAEAAAVTQRKALARLRDGVHAASKPRTAPDPEGGDGDDPDGDEGGDSDDEAETASARRFVTAVEAMVRRMVPAEDLIRNGPDLNRQTRGINLADVAARAPRLAAPRAEPVIVASSGLPGTAPGGRISGIDELTRLMAARARMLPVTHGNPNYVPVATLQREHRYRLSLDSTPAEVDEVLTAAMDVQALTAAGGWCAPSEISYDFFNVVCEDGMVDLPSVGVLNRGGFRFPTSPSIADIFAASPSSLWSWTETQDIAAATGTGQSGTKTCARIPCPAFTDVRALCDGLCVTVGNLIDFAYPELVANHLRLIMAGRAHLTNQRIIEQLVAQATAVSPTDVTGGAAAPILGAIDLYAVHTRERFRMCQEAVIEAVLPRWAIGPIRGDLAKRNGLALFDVTMGMVADWFNVRNIRVQFVADWQNTVIGHPTNNPVAWPLSVLALVYPPGTFVRGQGLQLDLGVVRDSTLNATNDFTGAWMEDCYAIARVGHGALLPTIPICTDGTTGAADLTTCFY